MFIIPLVWSFFKKIFSRITFTLTVSTTCPLLKPLSLLSLQFWWFYVSEWTHCLSFSYSKKYRGSIELLSSLGKQKKLINKMKKQKNKNKLHNFISVIVWESVITSHHSKLLSMVIRNEWPGQQEVHIRHKYKMAELTKKEYELVFNNTE